MYKHYRNDKEFKIEKEIEEMAKDFTRFEITTKQGISVFAEKLYDLGYRKIPENAVVLTRERYDYLSCWYSKFVEICDEVVKQVRKETAENFAERLKEKLEENSPFVGYDLEDLEFDGETIQESIDEIAKEMGAIYAKYD